MGLNCLPGEILVFGHYHHDMFGSVFADRPVVRRTKSDIQNVKGIVSLARQIVGQGFRELVINQEFHADCGTICSV